MNKSLRNEYLSAMGIDIWVDRDECIEVATNQQTNIVETTIELKEEVNETDLNSLNLEELANAVVQCQRCELLISRKNSIFGSGNKQADLFIIGSIPSSEEDTVALNFVGLEGTLLNNMLQSINLTRKEVYTTTLIKCAAKNHREFSLNEMNNCTQYIEQQINIVKPKVILIFGDQASQFIVKTENKMATLVINDYKYSNSEIPVVVIEHPEQLLLSGSNKKLAWVSLLKIKSYLQ